MFSRQRNRLARRVAIRCWAMADKSSFAALESCFRADKRICNLDPATILLLLKLAYALWKWWSEHKVEQPSEQPVMGEPGHE